VAKLHNNATVRQHLSVITDDHILQVKDVTVTSHYNREKVQMPITITGADPRLPGVPETPA